MTFSWYSCENEPRSLGLTGTRIWPYSPLSSILLALCYRDLNSLSLSFFGQICFCCGLKRQQDKAHFFYGSISILAHSLTLPSSPPEGSMALIGCNKHRVSRFLYHCLQNSQTTGLSITSIDLSFCLFFFFSFLCLPPHYVPSS